MNTNKLFFVFCYLFLTAVQAMAQDGLTVPSQMRFADVELTIEPRTRDKIQQRVNQIAGNWTLYKDLSERAQLYSPLIAQVLREESCPDDLRYMALQLSELTPDATSPRQPGAAGFWLMSVDIAKENGLQVDNTIDERKSVITATRAFARAMHKNNYSMRNWVYAAIAYQAGLTNAFAMIDRSRIGLSQLNIDETTPDFIIDLLAYTSVFRGQQNMAGSPIQLLVYNQTQGKTLEAIASAANLPVEQLRYYNSWLMTTTIPANRNLPVYLPVANDRATAVSAALKIDNPNQGFMATAARTSNEIPVSGSNIYPIITNRIDKRISNKDFTFATINGISGMVAADAQSIDELAAAAGISKNRLIKLNDFSDKSAALGAGQVLYLKAKANKGPVKEHLTLPNESFWSIAQTYGMTLSSLLKLNRIEKNETLQPGRVLALQVRRAKNAQPEYRELPAINPAVVQDAPQLQIDNTVVTTDPNANAMTTGIHIVQSGESIYDIANKYKVGITDLRRWNGITGFTLNSGMELKIRGEAEPTITADTTTTAIATNVPATTDSTLIAPPTSDIDVLPNQQAQQQPTHTVKAGDNIYSIAQQYKITLTDLRKWNNLQIDNFIKPGDVLKLYDPTASVVAGAAQQLNVVSGGSVTKHIVQRGETLTKIATKYNTTVANLRTWNNLQTDGLAINQELIVSGTSSGINAAAPNTTVVNIMPQTGTTTTPVTNTTATTSIGTGRHKVIFGQSVEEIVKIYSISVDDFYRWNNLPVGTTALAAGTDVFVADPALAGSTAVNVMPQPYTNTNPANTNNTTNTTVSTQPTTVTGTGVTVNNAPAQVANTGSHKVEAGETLFSIARKFNVPVADLMQWNNMDMNTRLQLGQNIVLQAPASTVAVSTGTETSGMLSNISEPTGVASTQTNIQAASANPAAGTEEVRIYTTVPGDNIYDLANRFGARLNDFRKWNNIPPGVFSLPAGTPVAINEAAAAQVEAMKAQSAAKKSTDKGVIAEAGRPAVKIMPEKTSVVYHVVNKGETLFGIAKKYNVKVTQIKAWNKMKNDQVNIGSRIIVSQ